jgi:dual specificity MAP kinase phosphatase
MATVFARPAPLPGRSSSPSGHLSINTSQRNNAAAVPNKHIPYCSPGPQPTPRQLDTPPASPPASSQLVETTSLLHPPAAFKKLSRDPVLYSISASALVQALDHIATQPLPSTKQVFPWLHGLHADNQLQLAFFIARKKSLRRTPKCIRGITVVKAGGDLTHSKLKGAVAPDEILHCHSNDMENYDGGFLEIDPREGFSVRNFQIQACKMATVSDIVVYGDNKTPRREVENLAKRISRAQALWQKKIGGLQDHEDRPFNTFVVSGKSQSIPL